MDECRSDVGGVFSSRSHISHYSPGFCRRPVDDFFSSKKAMKDSADESRSKWSHADAKLWEIYKLFAPQILEGLPTSEPIPYTQREDQILRIVSGYHRTKEKGFSPWTGNRK